MLGSMHEDGFTNHDISMSSSNNTAASIPLTNTTIMDSLNKHPQSLDDSALSAASTLIEQPITNVSTPQKSSQLPCVEFQKLLDIRKNKIDFKEKPMHLSKHPYTILELAKFFAFRTDPTNILNSQSTTFDSLIAMLIQDSSFTLHHLLKTVTDQLCPITFENQSTTREVSMVKTWLESCIVRIASRNNYGFQLDNGETPLSVSVFRWEVKHLDLFQPEIRKLIETRMAARDTACKAMKKYIQDLSPDARASLFSMTPGTKRKADGAEIRSSSKEAKIKEKESRDIERQRKENEKAAEKQRKENEKAIEKQRKEDEKALERAAKKCKKDAERKASKEAKELNEVKEVEEREKKKNATPGQKTLAGFVFSVSKEKKETVGGSVACEYADYMSYFQPFHVKETVTVSSIHPLEHVKPFPIGLTFPEIDINSCILDFKLFCSNKSKIHSVRRFPRNLDLADDGNILLQSRTWKLIGFAENIRPPYFGTWSKVSKYVTGRRPFCNKEPTLEYDVDSEAEWEEDEPGEELKSEDEDEDEDITADDDEDENQWLVPHGYLSDDEGIEEDDPGCDSSGTKPKMNGDNPSKRKNLVHLVPVISGPHFSNTSDPLPATDPLSMLTVEIIGDYTIPIDPYHTTVVHTDDIVQVKKTPKSQKSMFPKEHLPDLIQLVSGREARIADLVDEFKALVPTATKAAIESMIRSIAIRKKEKHDTRHKWYLIEPNLLPLESTPTKSPFKQTCVSVEIPAQPIASIFETPKKKKVAKQMTLLDTISTPTKTPTRAFKQTMSNSTSTKKNSTPPKNELVTDAESIVIPLKRRFSDSCHNTEMLNVLKKADQQPNVCLELLSSEMFSRQDVIAGLSCDLLTALIMIVLDVRVDNIVKSKCMRLVGNYVTVVETLGQLYTESEDGSTYQLASVISNTVFSSSEFLNAMDQTIALSKKNNAEWPVIKNALRVVAHLLASEHVLSKTAYKKFESDVANKWNLSIGMLLSEMQVEAAGYAAAIISQSIHACHDQSAVVRIQQSLSQFINQYKDNEQCAGAIAYAQSAIQFKTETTQQ
ncbi:hypothetical protein MT418_006934 [Batrachochytrium dendrobatidis]